MTARSLPGRALTIRARRPADVPALAEILLAQQAGSRYPFRDPLPVPVEEFLHAETTPSGRGLRSSTAGSSVTSAAPDQEPDPRTWRR